MIKNLTKNAKKPKGFWGRMMIKKMNYGHEPMTLWAINRLKINEADKILDVGCGGGNAVNILAGKATKGTVFGIDYSPLSVKSSVKKNKKAVKRGSVKIAQGSVSALPYDDNTFDIVTAIETIYFWPKPESDFKEVYRVLKKGGKFCAVCEMVKNDDGTGNHTDIAEFLKLHYFSQKEITDLFKKAGFSNLSEMVDKNKGWLVITGIK